MHGEAFAFASVQHSIAALLPALGQQCERRPIVSMVKGKGLLPEKPHEEETRPAFRVSIDSVSLSCPRK
jgi:hypothetical protein